MNPSDEKLIARLEAIASACTETIDTHWEDSSGELIIDSPLQLAADLRVILAALEDDGSREGVGEEGLNRPSRDHDQTVSGAVPSPAARHTPGPWVSSKFGFQVLTGDSWSTVCTLAGDACWEDRRGDYPPEYEWQRQEANANLIAAAPELLIALQALVADVREYERINNLSPNPGRADCWQSTTRALAAIAKVMRG